MIIAFEGIDGSGKDTQLKMTEEWLTSLCSDNEDNAIALFSKAEIFIEHEPTTDSAPGRKLHRLLKKVRGDKDIDSLNQELISELYLKDRLAHSIKLRQLTQKGIVLLSRYDLSTYAYQSLNLQKEEQVNFFAKIYCKHRYRSEDGCLIPDLTLFFTLTPSEAMSRVNKRGNKEGFEKIHVLKNVKKNYEQAIDYLAKKDGRSIEVINASPSPKILFEQVKKFIFPLINKVKRGEVKDSSKPRTVLLK